MSHWRRFCETHGRPYLALQFLNGPQAGSEAPLKNGDEAILGRGSDAHVLIDERKASRQHARLYYKDDQLFVRDLGSVNGTLVNGSKIDFTPIYPGDLIEIAGVRMKLLNRQRISEASWKWWRDQRRLQQTRQGSSESDSPTMDTVLAGNLRSFPLADVFKLLDATRKTGVLALDTVWGIGELAYRNGAICSAGLPTRESRPTLQTIARLTVAAKGEFEFCAGEFNALQNAIEIEPEALAEAASQLPEVFSELEAMLPSYDSFLKAAKNELTETDPETTTTRILKVCQTPTPLANILERFPGKEAEAAKATVDLLKSEQVKTLN